MRIMFAALLLALLLISTASRAEQDDGGIRVDKDKRTITVEAKIAPRKLPNLKEVYPIEVVATWPHPKGQKAHETVVTIEAKPSAVHKAVESLGLKAGAPVMGGTSEPQGPEVNLFLEIPTPDGQVKRLAIDKAMVDKRTGKPFPKSIRFRFTGSAMKQPDPQKPDKVYGADLSGTLISIFPVTDQTVFQTNQTMENEKYLKLEVNAKALPQEGTAVKLVIEVPKK